MDIVVSLALLFGAGLPLSYAIVRHQVVAVVLAPLVTGLVCSGAVITMLVVGGPLGLWLAIATIVSFGCAALLLRRPRSPVIQLGLWDVVVMYAPLLLPALAVLRPPVIWDARSIWWFHAAWFQSGDDAAQAALGNPALVFSHPDYPPFSPATIAGAWTVTGAGLRNAQVISLVLSLSAIAVLAAVVRNLVPAAPPPAARIAALAVALGAWFLASGAIAAGYTDHLWAAALAGAAVLLLVDRRAIERVSGGGVLGLAVVLMCVAVLTKNEGLVAAVLLALLASVRGRRQLGRTAWVWLPVALGVVWSGVARSLGAVSDLASSPSVGNLLGGDLRALDRAPFALGELVDRVGLLVGAALVVTLVGAAVLRSRWAAEGLGSPLWALALVVGFSASLVGTYVVSPYDLEWHVTSSVDRAAVMVVLLALAVVASWVLVASAGSSGEDRGEADTPTRGRQRSDPAAEAVASRRPVTAGRADSGSAGAG